MSSLKITRSTAVNFWRQEWTSRGIFFNPDLQLIFTDCQLCIQLLLPRKAGLFLSQIVRRALLSCKYPICLYSLCFTTSMTRGEYLDHFVISWLPNRTISATAKICLLTEIWKHKQIDINYLQLLTQTFQQKLHDGRLLIKIGRALMSWHLRARNCQQSQLDASRGAARLKLSGSQCRLGRDCACALIGGTSPKNKYRIKWGFSCLLFHNTSQK